MSAPMVHDELIANLNCSRASVIVRHSQLSAADEPMDIVSFETKYNWTCWWYLRTSSPMSSILNDKLAPAIMILTMITNILICIVLTRKHMVTSTNVILLAMAIADMLTSVFPLPIYISSNFVEMSPHSLAIYNLINILSQYLPTSWHAASVWLTVYLAVHRFIFVSFPTRVNSWCSVRKSSIVTFAIFVVFLFFNAPLLLFKMLLSVSFACDQPEPQWQAPYILNCQYPQVSKAYLLARLAFMHILPCVTLTIFTFLLILFMNSAVRNRRRLLKSSQDRDNHSKEANSTSRMLIVVLGIFLVVEVPTGITVTLTFISENFFNPQLTEVLNFAIVVSYPVNFFVYCGMSRQFRDTFRSVFGLQSQQDAHNPAGTTRTEVSRFVRGSLRPQDAEPDEINGVKKNGKEKKKKRKKDGETQLAGQYEVEDPREPRHLLPPSPSAARKGLLPLETAIDAEKETLVPRGPTA